MPRKKYLSRLLPGLLATLFFGVATTSSAKPIIAGVYGVRSASQDEMLKAAKDSGFDVVVTNDIARAQANGLKCLYSFSLTKEIASDEKQWSIFASNVKKVVAQYKNNPTIFGWYLADEPDWNQVPASRYKELNRIIKEIDKSKPTICVLTLPTKWYSYLPYFDIIAIDPYLPNRYTGRETDKVREWIQKVQSDFSKLKINKPLWVVLDAFEEMRKDGGKAAFRKPTPAEFNTMLQTSLAHGVAGILIFCLEKNETSKFYGWNLLRDDPLLWRVVRNTPHIVHEVNDQP